ncbi:MAG: carbohydrate ABC transporter permease [Verrucomicrobiia bacterium]|jgi:multiple sugar transport system permease protein
MRGALRKTITYMALGLVGLFMLLPFLWMLSTSVKPAGDVFASFDSPIKALIPREAQWQNYGKVYDVTGGMGGGFARWYLNSLVVAVVVTLGQVATSAGAAYAFARLRFPGRDKLFFSYLATMMIPGAVTMIPNFILMRKVTEWLTVAVPFVNWDAPRVISLFGRTYEVGRLVGLDSYFALIVPAMFSAYGTFMLRQFFMSLPRDLEEAATIDGCGLFRIFTTIILPLSKPALATLTIFTFMGNWQSFYWPLIMLTQDSMKTLPLGLLSFMGLYSTQWTLLMAGSMMMILPMILIFILGQKWFISGIQLGALKG